MDSTFGIAVHALVFLNHKKCVLSSEELAANICTNPVRVRRVMSMLGKAGIVETRAGHVGGYSFAGDADNLTLERVAEALQTCFVSTSWRSGDSDMECLVASGMADIMDSIYSQLNDTCRTKLKGISIGDIDRRIFPQENQTGSSKKQ